jgi:hypothetical protein
MRERILKSLNANNLKTEEWENAAHVVASLGAAQIGNRRHMSIGAKLLHIKAGHHRFLPEVLSLLTMTITSRARRDCWKGITKERAHTLARIALDYHLDPLCPNCHGVGRIGELGKVIVICSKADGGCGGTGKREQGRWHGWMERVRDVLSMLERYEGYASGGTRRQARGGSGY